jgi:hypothetical protein
LAEYTAKQIAGYRSRVVAGIRACDDGATVELDITTARHIATILLHMQKEEPPPCEPPPKS